jgi:Uma2 family endonuclease
MADPALKQHERYTYRDYQTWPENERWELIAGVAYAMSPAPNRWHQKILGELHRQIANYLVGKTCEVYAAPFDVRLPEGCEADDLTTTVVQPDISVVCDPTKLDKRGYRGGPDWIIEILSPATAKNDLAVKLRLYEKHRVREYWIVHPDLRIVMVYSGRADGKYGPHEVFEANETVPVGIFEDITIDLAAVFRGIGD